MVLSQSVVLSKRVLPCLLARRAFLSFKIRDAMSLIWLVLQVELHLDKP